MFNLKSQSYMGVGSQRVKQNYEHIQAEEGHPGSSIRLSERPTIGERLGTIKCANVIESKETTLEDVLPLCILSINPLKNQALVGII